MPKRERLLILWPSVIASIAMLLWMGHALVTGQIPFTGDLLHWNYPLRDFYAGAIAKGQRPWWMPSIYGGFDVAGEGQLGVFHPLHWLLYRFVPLDRAFDIELVLPYVLLLTGTWVWLRRRLSSAPAAFAAMLFAFCGFNLLHGVHMNMVAVISHVPWLLYGCDRAFGAATTRDARASGAVIALVTGSQILLGHPQAVWWSALLVVSYAAFLALTGPGERRLASLTTVAGGACLGAGIGAVQLLATWYAVQHSSRPMDDAAFATSYSLPPLQLVQLIEPYLLWGRILRWNEVPGAGDEFTAYAGAVTLALTVWWVAASRVRGERGTVPLDRLAWWGLILACVGLWLATGRYGGLYYVQTWLPVIREFRAPVRYVLFTQLGLSLVSAVALAHLATTGHDVARAARRAAWAPWTLAAVSAAVSYWLIHTSRVPAASSSWALVTGPLLFAAAAGLITLAARGTRMALVGLVLLAAGDQALYGIGGVIAWQDFVTRERAEGFLDEPSAHVPADDGRVARGGFPDLHVLGGYRLIDGYVGIAPKKALDYRRPTALRVAGVHYAHADFLASTSVPGAVPLAHGWFKLPPPLPRARLVSEARVTTDPGADLERIDVAQIALTTRALNLSSFGGRTTKGQPGTAAILRDDPGDIGIGTEANGEQLLVVSESFSAGWRAKVDGRPVEVQQVNGDFLGVVVPAGQHAVALTFEPPYYASGRAVSLASFAVGLLLLASGLHRRRG